jgi:hypothetical protein
MNGTPYPNQKMIHLQQHRNASPKHKMKRQKHHMLKENWHNTKKLQCKKKCVLEFQITKNDLRPHNLRLYPINKISRTLFTLELV